jgi:hypothetical protein
MGGRSIAEAGSLFGLGLSPPSEIATMPSVVLGFAARMGAGKSRVSKDVAEQLHAPRVSFGEYVRQVARDRGLPETREILQDLERALVQQDVRGFCARVLDQAPWRPGMPLVIDGVRHPEVLRTLEELVSPAPFRLVYLPLDRETPLTRLANEDLPHQGSPEECDRHPTDAEVSLGLPEEADLVLEGTCPIEQLVQQVVEYATRAEDMAVSEEWDQKNSRRIELAKKKNRGELTAEERAEFEALQKGFFDYLEAKHPRPTLDLDRLEQIEARLRSTSSLPEVE